MTDTFEVTLYQRSTWQVGVKFYSVYEDGDVELEEQRIGTGWHSGIDTKTFNKVEVKDYSTDHGAWKGFKFVVDPRGLGGNNVEKDFSAADVRSLCCVTGTVKGAWPGHISVPITIETTD